jgi:crotonobetainyl-CoA:carnitine CoA-transferase CaiB-like acyl-CoA transferase
LKRERQREGAAGGDSVTQAHPEAAIDPARPYAGLRVLDASQGLAGPYCAMLLAQHGAQVIKVEPPEGDWSRGIGTRHGDATALSLAANRGKSSLVVDLKAPGATAALRRVAARADVFLESFRPGVAERLGLGYAALSADNPGLVYASISGYGASGPYAQRPGTDTVLQAFSGMMSLNRDGDGRPNRVGFLVVDTLTALYAFQALSAALYARRAGAGGRHLELSLMQAAAAFLAPKVVEHALEGEAARPLNVPAGVYRTRDGWIAVTLSRESHFPALCRALERPDLAADPRNASFETRADHQAALKAAVAETLAQRGTAQWLERFAANEVMANPVSTLGDWIADPHVQAVGAATRIDVPGVGGIDWPGIPGVSPPAPGEARAAWSRIGEGGLDALRGFGFDDAAIAQLKAAGIGADA